VSKKTKTVVLEDLGEVTLSALTAGWLEENGDAIATPPTTTSEGMKVNLKIIHASLQKRSPQITLEQLRDNLDFGEVTELAKDVMVISKLLKEDAVGEVAPENLSQASSSES
jgi:hypothetical protein